MSEHVSQAPHESHHHITPPKVLFFNLLWLMALMALTIWASYWDLGNPVINNVIAMAIAITKAGFVIAIFMGVIYGTKLTKLYALLGFVWLIVMFFTFADYVSREWEPVPGWEKQAENAFPRGASAPPRTGHVPSTQGGH